MKSPGKKHNLSIARLKITAIMVLVFLSFQADGLCFSIDTEKLAQAIYLAEGGANTKYPYGILTKYKTTTPKQACINTINSNLRKWNGEGDFIVFLGQTYCPPNAHPLNKNWVKNVKYFYGRLK